MTDKEKLEQLEAKYKKLLWAANELAKALSLSGKFLNHIHWDWTQHFFTKKKYKNLQKVMEEVYIAQQKSFGHFVNTLYDEEL